MAKTDLLPQCMQIHALSIQCTLWGRSRQLRCQHQSADTIARIKTNLFSMKSPCHSRFSPTLGPVCLDSIVNLSESRSTPMCYTIGEAQFIFTLPILLIFLTISFLQKRKAHAYSFQLSFWCRKRKEKTGVRENRPDMPYSRKKWNSYVKFESKQWIFSCNGPHW